VTSEVESSFVPLLGLEIGPGTNGVEDVYFYDDSEFGKTSSTKKVKNVSMEDLKDLKDLTMTESKAVNNSSARNETMEPLTDEHCLLATPWIIGLDLKTKDWAKFCVSDLAPIVWNDAAFEHLVLPNNEKELAWAFVESKALAANDFDDFVQDKGKGVIILMFGPPGVGKTYTAEAVAERSRVPLYAMSAGSLGTSPQQVEAALDRALELCWMWNAMLLLDEADVFLSARTDSDITRNELVAGKFNSSSCYKALPAARK
jgi:hypothetical protein